MAPQVVSFGELLIDFVSMDRDAAVGDASSFIKAPGGAPANVAVGLAKLGIETAFMGQLGDDFFGHYLAGVLQENNVDISGLRFTDKAMTMLAFVAIEASGERSFVFYRKPSANMLMTEADVNKSLLEDCKIFHYGSITLIDDPERGATLAAINHAKQHGALISYDPNLREPLWSSLDAAKEGLMLGLKYANVMKLSEEELTFLTGIDDIAGGVEKLWHDDLRLIVVTKGAGGCEAFTRENSWQVPSFGVSVEDTIGAGDGFVAGLLSGLLSFGDDWEKADLAPILRRANAVGALAATKQGGIPALPYAKDVDKFIQANGK